MPTVTRRRPRTAMPTVTRRRPRTTRRLHERAGTTKRAATDDEADSKKKKNRLKGRPQLLLNTDELRKRAGKKYCDESELVPLLLAHGLVRRVRTIAVEVQPLSGESFDIKLDAQAPTVGEAKEQIERDEGTKPRSQLLCRVQLSSDGSNVREFDQEPEELKDDGMALAEGDVIAMGVMNEKQWLTYPKDLVLVSEDGMLATQTTSGRDSLTTTGEELTEGRHYWEVQLTGDGYPAIGVCRPNLDARAWHGEKKHTTAWLMHTYEGTLHGNGKNGKKGGYGYKKGDRVGVLLDLDDGSLRFFNNGVRHRKGYPAGRVTGPVTLALQMYYALPTGPEQQAARLLPDAAWPAGYSPRSKAQRSVK